MKSMRDLLAIVDQNRQNLNENIQTAPRPGVPKLSYSEFDPELAVDPDDPSLNLPDRFSAGDDSIDVPMNFDNNEDGDVIKEQGVAETQAKHGDGKELYVGIEAYGIKGIKSTPWRKRFKSQAAFEKWLDNTEGDVEVLGTREVNLNDSLIKEGVAEGSWSGWIGTNTFGPESKAWKESVKGGSGTEQDPYTFTLGTELNTAGILMRNLALIKAGKEPSYENFGPTETKIYFNHNGKLYMGDGSNKIMKANVDQVRVTEKAASSKTRHPFQGRLVGGTMESQTYYIKHRGTGEIFESFDNLSRAQRRYSQLGDLQADYRLTKKR